MRAISLLEFVDIHFTSGSKKDGKIKELKKPYDVKKDLYKRVRETIIKVHESDESKEKLDEALKGIKHSLKKKLFPDIISGYKKWWGENEIKWFEPPNFIYTQYGVQLSVNPELGLIINGKRYLVKLYFKLEKFKKAWVNTTTNLMSHNLSNLCFDPKSVKMAILDVRRSKLFTQTEMINDIEDTIDAELSYIARLLRLSK